MEGNSYAKIPANAKAIVRPLPAAAIGPWYNLWHVTTYNRQKRSAWK